MRYFIGFLVTVGLLIILIILLFHSGSKTNVPTTSVTLVSYANTNSQVRLTIDGPINADQIHQQIQITVNKDTVTYDQIQGYNNTVENQQQFDNNENAYDTFLHALQLAGFTEGDTGSALKDERGHCALGKRYIYELIQNGNDLERFWSTSCGNIVKTYNGLESLTISLFEAQVPDYKALSKSTNL
jgi:hypothetical protein